MKVRYEHILIIFVVTFFIVYSYLPITTPPKFVSPDENVNYFFINLYAKKGALSYSEPLNEISQGIIHPRTATYFNGEVVPTKFLGLYLVYGTVARVIDNLILYLTPLFAVIGVLFFYLLLKDIFNKEIAAISSLFLFVLPPFLWWSSLTMYGSIAALTLFLASLRYFFRLLKRDTLKYYILTALFLGLNLSIRPQYIFSVIPLGLVIFLKKDKINYQYLLLSIVLLIVVLSPFFILNKELYGGYFTTGYHIAYKVSELIPSPGIHLSNIIGNVKNLLELMPLLFIFTFLGIIHCFKSAKHMPYLIYYLTFSLLLIFYNLNQPVVGPPSLHISYVRYLLPIYVLSIPFFTIFFYYIKIKKKRRALVVTLAIFVIIITNTQLVLPNIVSIGEIKVIYANLAKNITRETEPNSVIFVQYWDKILFPERKVGYISELPENNRAEVLSNIMINLAERDTPVYLMKDRPMDYSALDEKLKEKQYELWIIDKKSQLYKLIKRS